MEEKSVNCFFNAFFPQSSGGGNMYIYKLLLLILMVFRVLLIKNYQISGIFIILPSKHEKRMRIIK